MTGLSSLRTPEIKLNTPRGPREPIIYCATRVIADILEEVGVPVVLTKCRNAHHARSVERIRRPDMRPLPVPGLAMATGSGCWNTRKQVFEAAGVSVLEVAQALAHVDFALVEGGSNHGSLKKVSDLIDEINQYFRPKGITLNLHVLILQPLVTRKFAPGCLRRPVADASSFCISMTPWEDAPVFPIEVIGRSVRFQLGYFSRTWNVCDVWMGSVAATLASPPVLARRKQSSSISYFPTLLGGMMHRKSEKSSADFSADGSKLRSSSVSAPVRPPVGTEKFRNDVGGVRNVQSDTETDLCSVTASGDEETVCETPFRRNGTFESERRISRACSVGATSMGESVWDSSVSEVSDRVLDVVV
eukprot:TRINITY_DN44825_c0_g1_i1.p1 TRINITY_DN44825_c0_g1~~TRINITY_DN44825_c0_g1_i1.p1  ORF type:complete len:423 (-),score=47.43 TRINITY_DN44825_c0_g1_i1:46-1125(-)